MLDFGKVSEIVECPDYQAVCARTALGGMTIEAFQKGSDAILCVVVSDGGHVSVYYAIMTESEFDDLSSRTNWENCGATSATDAVIVEAAKQWVIAHPRKFYKKGQRGQSGKMVPSAFTLDA